MKSNIEFLYEQLRKETDGGSESMTHEDAIEIIRVWRDAYYAQKYPQPKQEPVEFKHVCNLWIDPVSRYYIIDRCDHPPSECIPAYIKTAPQPQPKKRPQNCGTGFCSCIECPYPDHFPDAGKMVEPFGYFRSTLDGWEDCAETDEGARPLYEAPQPDRFADAGKPMERECEWHLDDGEHGIWESACGESWSFVDGGPAENRMMYCHRCGGKLREKNGETK